MTMHIMRRRKLGLGAAKGIKSVAPEAFTFGRPDQLSLWGEETTSIIRWGTTAAVPPQYRHLPVINKPEAIRLVSDKRSFAKLMGDEEVGPRCWTEVDDWVDEVLAEDEQPQGYFVARPSKHSQGKNLLKFEDTPEGLAALEEFSERNQGLIYIRPYIEKVAEFRVFVVCGKITSIANKIPDDPDATAWNVSQGGRFENVKWTDWNLEVIRVALGAFSLSGLHFAGVDVMLDDEGKAYVLEVNSAPSLPALDDGSTSYRQRLMAEAFLWHHENSWDSLTDNNFTFNSFRDVLHPSRG